MELLKKLNDFLSGKDNFSSNSCMEQISPSRMELERFPSGRSDLKCQFGFEFLDGTNHPSRKKLFPTCPGGPLKVSLCLRGVWSGT
jgi:hypothetical protein